jgi:hypothetical protein
MESGLVGDNSRHTDVTPSPEGLQDARKAGEAPRLACERAEECLKYLPPGKPASIERVNAMRLIAFCLALFFAGPAAAAEDWMEYSYPDLAFTVHFPVDPAIETTSYQAPDGRAFEAHKYSVAQDTGAFTITVAELPEGTTDENVLVGDAVKKMSEGGVVKFDIQHRIRAVYGRQLGIAGANGGYSYVAVFYHNKRLYQIEGKAFVGAGRRRSTPCASSSRSTSPEPDGRRGPGEPRSLGIAATRFFRRRRPAPCGCRPWR